MSTTHISEPTEPNAKSKDGQLLETISLRDYFAAKAMPQFIHEVFSENLADHGYDSVAGHAYRMADAMLKAREQ
jgi:hypothetical protein